MPHTPASNFPLIAAIDLGSNSFHMVMATVTHGELRIRERLSEVRYEIRGELNRRAHALEAEGRTLIKLNIGNTGAFGFRAPAHLQRAIIDDIDHTDPYTHQLGLPAAREALAAA